MTDVCWNAEEQIKLITSFYQNMPVPQIILSMLPFFMSFPKLLMFYSGELDNGKYNCVDGKQRLTSLEK